MKIKKLLIAGAFAAAVIPSAQAVVEINITGATAFRQAANKAIIAGYGGLTNVGIVHSNTAASQSSVEGASAVSYRGNFGALGDTIIRCRWSGSTEGIRDVAQQNDVFFYDDAQIPAVNVITAKNEQSNPVTANVAHKAKFAFSDVQQTSSAFRSPALSPADSRVGVVTFTMLKNDGAPLSLTNITSKAWRAILGNTQGTAFLDLFTGDSADAATRVFVVGRNDGSGTRHVYLIETGYGASKAVKQWKMGANTFNGVTSDGSTGDNLNILQFWPQSDAQDANNNSLQWGNNLAGNGGYFSGSNVRDVMKLKTASVTTVGPTGSATLAPNPKVAVLITCLSTADALNAMGSGALPVAFNGVGITPIATAPGLSVADLYKVTDGQYSLWSYERLYYTGSLSSDENTVYTAIKTDIPANLGSAGVAITSMNVSRTNDGDPIQ